MPHRTRYQQYVHLLRGDAVTYVCYPSVCHGESKPWKKCEIWNTRNRIVERWWADTSGTLSSVWQCDFISLCWWFQVGKSRFDHVMVSHYPHFYYVTVPWFLFFVLGLDFTWTKNTTSPKPQVVVLLVCPLHLQVMEYQTTVFFSVQKIFTGKIHLLSGQRTWTWFKSRPRNDVGGKAL